MDSHPLHHQRSPNIYIYIFNCQLYLIKLKRKKCILNGQMNRRYLSMPHLVLTSNHGGKLALVGPRKHMASPWLIIWTTPLRSFLEQHSGHSHGGKTVLNCNKASFFNIFQEKIISLYKWSLCLCVNVLNWHLWALWWQILPYIQEILLQTWIEVGKRLLFCTTLQKPLMWDELHNNKLFKS